MQVHVQLGLELAGSTLLGGSVAGVVGAIEAAAVTTLAITAGRTTALITVTTHKTAGGSVGAGLLDVGGRDNLGGEMEPLAEVRETGLSQGVVVVLPRELSLEVATAGEGLASLDDLYFENPLAGGFRGVCGWESAPYVKVLGVNVTVLGEVEVLLGDENSLTEEVLVDELAVGLGNKPGDNADQLLDLQHGNPPSAQPAQPILRDFERMEDSRVRAAAAVRGIVTYMVAVTARAVGGGLSLVVEAGLVSRDFDGLWWSGVCVRLGDADGGATLGMDWHLGP